MSEIDFNVVESDAASFSLSSSDDIAFSIGAEIYASNPYHGEYVVIPSEEVQTLQTGDCLLRQDVRIEPIPNNYGLITYDGTAITVS